MYKFFITALFLSINTISLSQDFAKKKYISAEFNYRSYGTNDHIGNGFGLEYSKEVNKWFGYGINASFFSNKKTDWDFSNPFTGDRYIYRGLINDYKVTPFVQLFPINTKSIDFFFHLGLKTGYYHQEFYLGGYNINYTPESFDNFIYDDGYKGIQLGYELGLGIRVQVNKMTMTPNLTLISNDLEGNSFSGINLKIGWQIK